MEERRKMNRFGLRIETLVNAFAPVHNSGFLILLSNNISATGVFLLTGEPLPLHTKVKLGFILPQKLGIQENEGKFLINTSGRVVRTSEKGMAISFDKKCQITSGGIWANS